MHSLRDSSHEPRLRFETPVHGMKYDVDLCFREPLEYRDSIHIGEDHGLIKVSLNSRNPLERKKFP